MLIALTKAHIGQSHIIFVALALSCHFLDRVFTVYTSLLSFSWILLDLAMSWLFLSFFLLLLLLIVIIIIISSAYLWELFLLPRVCQVTVLWSCSLQGSPGCPTASVLLHAHFEHQLHGGHPDSLWAVRLLGCSENAFLTSVPHILWLEEELHVSFSMEQSSSPTRESDVPSGCLKYTL